MNRTSPLGRFLNYNQLSRCGMAFAFLALASSANAQSGSENAAFFSYLGQGNSAVVNGNGGQGQDVADNACVPTATANGLSYLQAYRQSIGKPAPLSFTPTYTSVNNLISDMHTTAGGTGIADAANGLVTYLGAGGSNPSPTVVVSGQYSADTPANWLTGGFGANTNFVEETPTAQFLADHLNAHDAVEFTLQWGFLEDGAFSVGQGAHEVTLVSIDMDAGLISFIDPWGNGDSHADSSAVMVNATVQLLDGYLVVTYPIDWVGPDDNTGSTIYVGANVGQTGRILDDMVQSVVPEVSTLYLSGSLGVILIVVSIRRSRREVL